MRHVASLWIGARLGEIERAAIASFLLLGHAFTLYGYGAIGNLPAGVTLADASEILPGDSILRDRRSGSPAMHADLFRYAMVRATDALWVDLDMIALRPFDFDTPWVLGREDDGQLNNAVLGLPRESRLLASLCAITPATRGVPPHLRGLRRQKYRLRSALRGGLPITEWPWGSTGPRALTHFATLTGDVGRAMPPQAFYPVPIHAVRRFLTPGALRPEDLPADSFGVHLWGRELRAELAGSFGGRVPRGSFLDLIRAEGA